MKIVSKTGFEESAPPCVNKNRAPPIVSSVIYKNSSHLTLGGGSTGFSTLSSPFILKDLAVCRRDGSNSCATLTSPV